MMMVSTLLAMNCGGCSMFNKSSKELMYDQQVPLHASDSNETHKQVQQAKSQNSLVLQVEADSQPIRVLPLPPNGRPVFVSDLLKQTGIQEKMGRMIVTVYRPSPVDFAGAKMIVRFDDEGETVRPETDYSLQAGDRVKISKDTTTSLSKFVDQIIPPNASRAIIGR
jgi:hypothetical protein